jgi:hypothetical protein
MTVPTPTPDATVGGANSNSYVTLAEADAYFDAGADNQEWNNHQDGYKEAALIQATRWLNYLSFAGDICGDTQALQWPREEVTCMGKEATCTMIPLQVKQATYELAFKFVHDPDVINGGTTSPSPQVGAIKKQKLGDLEQELYEYKQGRSKIAASGPAVLQKFPWLVDILGCWLATSYGEGRVILRVRS